MKRYLIAVMALLIWQINTAYAEITNVIITPNPPYICGEVTFKATITGDNIIKRKLFFRPAFSVSGWISEDLIPCENGESNTYCYTIDDQFIDEYGIFWFIQTEDENKVQQWYGTIENPYQLRPFTTPQNPGDKFMKFHLKKSNIRMECGTLQEGDIISAYFVNNCRQPQIGGTYTVRDNEEDMIIKIYGKSDRHDDYKDGFLENEELQYLKITRNGKDYDIGIYEKEEKVYYKTGDSIYYDEKFDVLPTAQLEAYGNGESIPNRSTSISLLNGTDFGKTRVPIMNTFTFKNVSCGDAYISAVRLDDTTNFSVNEPSKGITVLPGDSVYISITYNALIDTITTVWVHGNVGFPNPFMFQIGGKIDTNVKRYAITYELDGGVNHPDNMNFYISGMGIELKEPSKIGYAFDAWYLDSDFHTLIEKISKTDTGDKILHAKFIEEEPGKIEDIYIDHIKIYPNPTKGIIYIDENEYIPVVKIYSIQGKLLLMKQDRQIDISKFPRGIYILGIHNKFVKIKKE